ncbi:unnamed protein product, partial [Iphiclides podalirius]
MTRLALLATVAVCALAGAAPPASQFYQQASQIQQINPLDYYLDNEEVTNFYNHGQQKQGNLASNGAPARLETLEPDSEVELIPGAQQPQPPQQNPVAPNIPGLLPGQRVFIVHMPVPGYRPGTIGGYQPVYIVAAGPQDNPYASNGFQNTVLLDPSGQVVSPGRRGPLLLGAPLSYRPVDLIYQNPVGAYQSQSGQAQGRGSFTSQDALQAQRTTSGANSEANSSNSEKPDRESENLKTKENLEEPRRNARPIPSIASKNTA